MEAVGRRIRHPHGGVLDIVFRDRANGDYVVVAVRPGRGTRAAVARLLEDVASVSDLYDTPRVARGVLVATDLDQRAELMLRGAGNLRVRPARRPRPPRGGGRPLGGAPA